MKKVIYTIFLYFLLINITAAHDLENTVLNATITKSSIIGDVYVYNMSNAKLHTSSCEWAEKCTKNCIYLDKKALKKMFYIPCAVCGGGIIEPVEE